MKTTVRGILLPVLVVLLGGCASYRLQAATGGLAAGPGVDLEVKHLKPHRLVQRCTWSSPWGRPPHLMDSLVSELLSSDPEADVLVDMEISFSTAFLLVASRHCASIRADVARRIRTVVLPSVGGHHH